MNTSMMCGAERNEIVEVGGAATVPKREVVWLTLPHGNLALWNCACGVHCFERLALLSRSETRGATQVENCTSRTENDGNDFCFTCHTTNGADGNVDVGSGVHDGVLMNAFNERAIVDDYADFCALMRRNMIDAIGCLMNKSYEPQRVEVPCSCFAVGAGAGGAFMEKTVDHLLKFAN
jgi:hypothetical protein